jgi:Fic family protein
MIENKKSDEKAALKQLRDQRKDRIKEIREMNKAQNKVIEEISEQIKTEGKTVPEIAQATGIETSQVLLYVSSLVEYGFVAEGAKEGDYFKYELLEK